MDIDDPTQPLLGCRNLESWRRRLPITIWLPNYSLDYLLRDAIAGITVGLTSIPQGMAYAMLAGLPPQVGLYSSIFPGIVYAFLGSCKDVTVGPTAILAALLAKYVAQSPDFAYLAAFLSGLLILLLGVLQLGFLLDFISKPVISGFTTAAALQIGASQLKSLFRVSESYNNDIGVGEKKAHFLTLEFRCKASETVRELRTADDDEVRLWTRLTTVHYWFK